MESPPKLTKKQRKGAAFRARRLRRAEDEPGEADADALTGGLRPRAGLKRTSISPEPSESAPSKRRKVQASASPEPESTPNSSTRRYILFVGNLSYTTSSDTIKQHFSPCDPPPDIRLITQKGSNKSKGCAFLEFTHRNALQQALKLHHTTIEGRKINVELTAGGGGKSAARTHRLKERNRNLDAQRKKRPESKQAKDGEGRVDAGRHRQSATSGETIETARPHTWTVGDRKVGSKSRGGKKHANRPPSRTKRKSAVIEKIKPTGANAISVA